MALVLRIQDSLNQNLISWGIQSGICKPLFHIISQIYVMVLVFILKELNLKILSNDGFSLYLRKSIISSKESHSLYITSLLTVVNLTGRKANIFKTHIWKSFSVIYMNGDIVIKYIHLYKAMFCRSFYSFYVNQPLKIWWPSKAF